MILSCGQATLKYVKKKPKTVKQSLYRAALVTPSMIEMCLDKSGMRKVVEYTSLTLDSSSSHFHSKASPSLSFGPPKSPSADSRESLIDADSTVSVETHEDEPETTNEGIIVTPPTPSTSQVDSNSDLNLQSSQDTEVSYHI